MRLRLSRFLSCLCIIPLVLQGCRPVPLVNNGAIDERSFERIVNGVQEAAKLRFRRPLRSRAVTVALAREFFQNAAKDGYGGEQALRAAIQVRIDLGFAGVPSDYRGDPGDVSRLALGVLALLTAAYEESPEMVAIVDGSDDRLKGQTSTLQDILSALSHPVNFATRRSPSELSTIAAVDQALIDQNFNVRDRINTIQQNYDERIALVWGEWGEGLLVRDTILRRDGDTTAVCNSLDAPSLWDSLFIKLSGLPTPAVTQIFPYFEERFVCQAYARGGWPAVNSLYSNPPRSTQQFLHPALYYDHAMLPLRVTLAGYQDVLNGWAVVYEDTLGELSLLTLVAGLPGRGREKLALFTQWAGDRVVALRSGDEMTVIWLIIFRDKAAASKFYGLYSSSKSPRVRTAQDNRSVLVVAGPGAEQFDQLAPRVWRETVVQ